MSLLISMYILILSACSYSNFSPDFDFQNFIIFIVIKIKTNLRVKQPTVNKMIPHN